MDYDGRIVIPDEVGIVPNRIEPAVAVTRPGFSGNVQLGVIDRPDWYNRMLTPSPYTRNFIIAALNSPPFDGDYMHELIPQMTYLYAYVKCHQRQAPEDNNIFTVMIGELLSPNIPAGLPTVDARIRFCLAPRYIMMLPRLTTILALNAQTWENAVLSDGPLSLVFTPARLQELPVEYPWPGDNDVNLTIEEAIGLMMRLETLMKQDYSTVGFQALVFTHVAMARKGMANDRILTKISDDVLSETGIVLNFPDATVPTIFRAYGEYITENNAGSIFEYWEQCIPAHALRLKLNMRQTALAGITALMTILEAVQLANGFNWGKIDALIPGELTKFTAAVNAVNGNAYYGFKKELGIVASTNYKSISYVAKELLIRGFGKDSLKNYKGWTSKPAQADKINAIIDDYITEMAAAADNPTDANVTVSQNLTNLLTNEAVVALLNPMGLNQDN